MKARRKMAVLVLALAAVSRCASRQSPAADTSPQRAADSSANCHELKPPVLLVRQNPEYPAIIRKQGIQGRVRLDAFVETDGRVSDIRVIETPGPELSLLAQDAFRQQRYKPASCDGVPIRMAVTFSTDFHLDR